MLNKTSSSKFNKYGINIELDELNRCLGQKLSINNDNCQMMYRCDRSISISETEGLVLLVCAKNLDDPFDLFIIKNTIELNPGIYFNFINLTKDAVVTLHNTHLAIITLPLIKPFHFRRIKPTVQINEIFACYYTIRQADYIQERERHDYYELIIIDEGTLITKVDDKVFELKPYDAFIYRPNQYHEIKIANNHTCSYLTIIFDMDVVNNDFQLDTKVYNLNTNLQHTLTKLIEVSDNPNVINNDLIISYLKEILVTLNADDEKDKISKNSKQENFENNLLNEILKYINENIHLPITVDDLCDYFNLSRSKLQNIFNEYINCSPKRYINDLKLKKAKQLIKENKYTIAEISYKLGFTSPHYFSNKFKESFGISPSEYSKRLYT